MAKNEKNKTKQNTKLRAKQKQKTNQKAKQKKARQTRAEKRAFYRSLIPQYTLWDDEFFMTVIDGQPKLLENILRPILGKDTPSLDTAVAQRVLPNLLGHASRADVEGTDNSGRTRKYIFEVQRDLREATFERAVAEQAGTLMQSLNKGEDYRQMAEAHVVFLAEGDLYNDGHAVHTWRYVCKETEEESEFPGKIVFVDGTYRGDDALGHMLSDMACSDPDAIQDPELAERVRYFKDTKEGVEIMSDKLEQFYNSMNADKINKIRKLEQREKKLLQSQDELRKAHKKDQRALTEKDNALAEKDNALAEKNRTIDQLQHELRKLRAAKA